MNDIYLSRNGYDRLVRKCEQIDLDIESTLKQMGESVKIDNDLRENPEFMELRVKAMYALPQLKAKLMEKKENAVIIEEMDEYKNFDGCTTIVGSCVTIDYEGDIETYIILGNDEGDLDKNILSCNAPLANALIGKKVSETIQFNGKLVKILDVKKYAYHGD